MCMYVKQKAVRWCCCCSTAVLLSLLLLYNSVLVVVGRFGAHLLDCNRSWATAVGGVDQ